MNFKYFFVLLSFLYIFTYTTMISSSSIFTRFYGDSFIGQAAQMPEFSETQYNQYNINLALKHATQNNFAVLEPCYGISRGFLEQKVRCIKKNIQGNLIFGMDGKTDTNDHSNMILGCITSQGMFVQDFGSSGFVLLPCYQSEEYISDIIQDVSGRYIVAGYGSTGSILRCYESFGDELWIADNGFIGSKVVTLGLQDTRRVLVGHQITPYRAQLAAYNLDDGSVDVTFNSNSHTPGGIDAADFGLHLGILHNVIILQDKIVILYTNYVTGCVDIAFLDSCGSGLITPADAHLDCHSIITDVFSGVGHLSYVYSVIDHALSTMIIAAQSGQRIYCVKYTINSSDISCVFKSTMSLNTDTIVIKKMEYLPDGSMMLCGYNQSSFQPIIFKIQSNGRIDNSFILSNQKFFLADPGILTNQSEHCINFYFDTISEEIIIAGCKQVYDNYILPLIMPLPYNHVQTDTINPITPEYLDTTVSDDSLSFLHVTSMQDWQLIADYIIYAVQSNKDDSLYVVFTNGAEIVIGLLDSSLQPIITYGEKGLSSFESMDSIESVMVDQQNRVTIAGKDRKIDKIVRYDKYGQVEKIIMPSVAQDVVVLAEQQSGTIVGSALLQKQNIMYGYQNTGDTLVSSFGLACHDGYFETSCNGAIKDLVIDQQDAIYGIWQDHQQCIYLGKIMPNGSRFVSDFNYGKPVKTDIIAQGKMHVAINQDQNILVAAQTDQGVSFCLYDGLSGQPLAAIQSLFFIDHCALEKIVATGSDFIGMIVTSDTTLLCRLFGQTGLLDPSIIDVASKIEFSLSDAACHFNNVTLQSDGKIILSGSCNQAPFLMKLYGYSSYGEYYKFPGRACAGKVDTTLLYSSQIKSSIVDGSGGTFNFNSLSQGVFNLDGYAIKRLYKYANGTMLYCADNGINSMIFRLLSNMSLDTLADGGSGFNESQTPGYIILPGCCHVTSLYVNEQGIIFVAGGSTQNWAAIFNHDGTTLSTWSMPMDNGSQEIYQVGQQSFGRYIVAGQNASQGVVYGYTPSGLLDQNFGVNGVYSTGINAPISDFFIDKFDALTVVYALNGSCVIQKISPQALDFTTLDNGTAIDNIIDNQIKIVQDVAGNMIIAAITDAGFVLKKYDDNGNDLSVQPIIINGLDSSPCSFGKLYVTTDNKIGLVGYQIEAGIIILSRLDENFNLDVTFNSGSVLLIENSPMNMVYDATVYLDSRIMIVGGSSLTPNPYLLRIFGDAYVDLVAQSPLQAIACTNDYTLTQSTSTGISCYSMDAGPAQGQQARAVALQGSDIFIALDGQSTANNEHRIFLQKMTQQGTMAHDFGVQGKVEYPHLYQHEYVQDMFLYQDNNNIYKALLAGYVVHNVLDIKNSLLTQYDLTHQSLDEDFGGFSGDFPGYAFGHIQAFFHVTRQSCGRIIASGIDQSGHGVIVGFTSQGRIDKSFGYYGYVYLLTTGICKHFVDDQNRIVIGYYDSDGHIILTRMMQDGKSYDSSFNQAGAIIVSNMLVEQGLHGDFSLACDAQHNIVVAAVVNFGIDIQIDRYTSQGIFDCSYTITSAMLGGTVDLTLNKILVDMQGYVTIIAYDTQVASNIVVPRLLPDFSGLDVTANATNTPGFLKYVITQDTQHVVNDAIISDDGRMILVGSQS